jgi:putative tricarboxylic transport membrane protein
MIEAPQFVYDVVAMMFFASLAILLYGLTLTKLLVQVLRVRYQVIVPIIFVLCTVGSFAIAARLFDVWVMLGFGILGFALRLLNYPMAPLVLGLVLGELLEKSLRRGLVLADGDPTPFFTRPISAAIFALILLIVLLRVEAVRRVLARAVNRVMPGRA